MWTCTTRQSDVRQEGGGAATTDGAAWGHVFVAVMFLAQNWMAEHNKFAELFSASWAQLSAPIGMRMHRTLHFDSQRTRPSSSTRNCFCFACASSSDKHNLDALQSTSRSSSAIAPTDKDAEKKDHGYV